MKNRRDDEEERRREADTIFITSILMGEIVVWLLIGLLTLAGIKLIIQSFTADVTKILIVFAMIAGLIALSVFMVKAGKKRMGEIRRRNN